MLGTIEIILNIMLAVFITIMVGCLAWASLLGCLLMLQALVRG